MITDLTPLRKSLLTKRIARELWDQDLEGGKLYIPDEYEHWRDKIYLPRAERILSVIRGEK